MPRVGDEISRVCRRLPGQCTTGPSRGRPVGTDAKAKAMTAAGRQPYEPRGALPGSLRTASRS